MGYILVVDDEELNRDMLSRRLGKKGFDTLTAESGQKALELIDSNDIDLVLLDIRMPGMDGNEVLEEIRKTKNGMTLPVIMVTAETDSNTMVKSLGLGANDYVTKPIDLPVLLARMESKLALSQSVKEQLSSTSSEDDIFNVEEVIAKGESQHIEFKSTLRWNIHSGQMGKEIEQAWMKTVVAFLNSEGGTLLVGVADDGEIIGTELDKFKNDDKYLLHVNNSIKNHIGVEYANYIKFDLVDYQEKKVLCVECKPFDEAVFLNMGKEEEFYVRFGPSSKKLTTKEALGYMQNRG